MPKPQRKPEEVNAFRENILAQAVKLMTEEGFHNFSMRKLAMPLGIAAKTIYNYFRNKDELNLAILTKGFEDLYDCCHRAYQSHRDPLGRMDAMLEAYLSFGLEQANVYNLMFTLHVPKYNDYVGTSMEPTARLELETSMSVLELFVGAIKACGDDSDSISDKAARFIMIRLWTHLHGFIAGYNSSVLDYMHEVPMVLRPVIFDRIKRSLRNELNHHQQKKPQVIGRGL